MADQPDGGPEYEIYGSASIMQDLRDIQRRAAHQGRGEEALAAIREIARRLQRDPLEQGEPRYRLPALRMQVRTIAIRPLVMEFGVHEDRPLVFIKSVKLLGLLED